MLMGVLIPHLRTLDRVPRLPVSAITPIGNKPEPFKIGSPDLGGYVKFPPKYIIVVFKFKQMECYYFGN